MQLSPALHYPSSRNLHPTDAYMVVTACHGIVDGIFHYVSRDHPPEQRCAGSPRQLGGQSPNIDSIGIDR
jgi:hypothetical protein